MKINSIVQSVGISILALMLTIAAEANMNQVLRVDRFQHLCVSFLLILFAYFILRDQGSKRISLSFIFALSIGFIKELTDPQFEWFDIIADLTGISLTIIFICIVTRVKVKPKLYAKRRLN